MNIKFNFYDIYGFALPGFLVLAILWFPFGLIEGKWPDAQLSSALAGLIIAYFAGHVLQTIAQNAIPSNFLDGRFPSTAFLDNGRTEPFSEEFKRRLANQIKEVFGLDIHLDTAGKDADGERRDAFFLCRSAIIKSKTVVYAEQFEGLYALMRGLSAALALAVVYYLGWAYSGRLVSVKRFLPLSWWYVQWSGLAVLLALIVALVALIFTDRHTKFDWFKGNKKRSANAVKYSKWVVIIFILLAFFSAGYYLGQSISGTPSHRGELIAAAVFSFFASERCYSGYKSFAQEFAKAVYRYFSNYEKPTQEGAQQKKARNAGVEPAVEDEVVDD